MVYTKNNKANFLGFDIKLPSKNDRAVVKNKKILNFKKIKNQIAKQKRASESRFKTTILKIYELQKLKTIKALIKKGKKSKLIKKTAGILAIKNARKIIKNENKWYNNQDSFNTWIHKEYIHLRSLWIKETKLEKSEYGEVIKSYRNFLKTLENAIINKNIFRFKKEKTKRIQTKPKSLQKKINCIYLGQPQNLNPKIYAPIYKLKKNMKNLDMLTESGKPKACGTIFKYFEISIIEFFKQKALGFLNYYKPASNYHEVKKLVNYHMRWSLLHTLSGKHSTKVHQIIKKYGKSPKVVLITNKGWKHTLTEFLTPNNIIHRSRGFVISHDPIYFKNNLNKPIVKLSIPKALFANKCIFNNIQNSDAKIHFIHALRRIKYGYTIEFIKSRNRNLN